jgi:hypothetical protein
MAACAMDADAAGEHGPPAKEKSSHRMGMDQQSPSIVVPEQYPVTKFQMTIV